MCPQGQHRDGPTRSEGETDHAAPFAFADRDFGDVAACVGWRVLPDRPRHLARLDELLEVLPVAERVHRGPEAVIAIAEDLVALDEPGEDVRNQVLARPDLVEDLPTEHEVAAVQPEIRLAHVLDAADLAASLEPDEVERVARGPYREERGELAAPPEPANEVREGGVRQHVAVVRQEDVVGREVGTRLPAAADRRVH